MSDLDVKVWREPAGLGEKGKLHIQVEASGETAQEIRDAVDYVNSRREQAPEKDENDE